MTGDTSSNKLLKISSEMRNDLIEWKILARPAPTTDSYKIVKIVVAVLCRVMK